jgi:hypothetical protein
MGAIKNIFLPPVKSLSPLVLSTQGLTARHLDARSVEGKELKAAIRELSTPEQISPILQHFLDTVTLQEINSPTSTSSPTTVFLDADLPTLPIAEILDKERKEIQVVRGRKQDQHLGQKGLENLFERILACYHAHDRTTNLQELSQYLMASNLAKSAESLTTLALVVINKRNRLLNPEKK